MQQRYLDATKCFNFILGYISKCAVGGGRGVRPTAVVGWGVAVGASCNVLPTCHTPAPTPHPPPPTRAKHQSRGAAYEQILKKNEQCYALLAAATALCPTANRLLDEAVANTLREK